MNTSTIVPLVHVGNSYILRCKNESELEMLPTNITEIWKNICLLDTSIKQNQN